MLSLEFRSWSMNLTIQRRVAKEAVTKAAITTKEKETQSTVHVAYYDIQWHVVTLS